jgi:hypothetical protein
MNNHYYHRQSFSGVDFTNFFCQAKSFRRMTFGKKIRRLISPTKVKAKNRSKFAESVLCFQTPFSICQKMVVNFF